MTSLELSSVRARVDQLAALVRPADVAATAGQATAGADESAGTAFAAALSEALGIGQGTAGASASGVTSGAAASLAGVLASAGASSTSASSGAASTAAASSSAGLSVSGTATGQALVEAARQYLGVPYVWGGESLAEGGLDCSGLVQLALSDVGVTGVPRVARDQATLGTAVASLDDAEPGDLLVFDGGTHIGIYAGEGQMIDAPRPGKTVQLRDVYETPSAIRRLLPQEATAASAQSSGDATASTADVGAQRALFEALLGVAA